MDTSVVGMVLLGIVVVWLALLTAGVLRWRRERGEPVYRRLPDGRLRFEWAVSNAYQSARRAYAQQSRSGPRLCSHEVEPWSSWSAGNRRGGWMSPSGMSVPRILTKDHDRHRRDEVALMGAELTKHSVVTTGCDADPARDTTQRSPPAA